MADLQANWFPQSSYGSALRIAKGSPPSDVISLVGFAHRTETKPRLSHNGVIAIVVLEGMRRTFDECLDDFQLNTPEFVVLGKYSTVSLRIDARVE